MASSSKKKTTFAKLNRENKLRERRQEKAAKRAARKLEASMPDVVAENDEELDAENAETGDEQEPAAEAAEASQP